VGLSFSPSGSLLADGTVMLSVSASGALTPVGGSPADPSARVVAFSPSGALLAAANEGGETISMFSVASSGALTAVPGSPFALGAQPVSMAFSPGGQLLAVSAGESVYMFSVGTSGALAPAAGSPYTVKGVGRAAFSPAGGLLAVPGLAGVSMFSISSSGALTAVAGSPFAASGAPGESAAFAGGGNLVRVAGFGSGKGEVLTSYSVASSGALTPIGSGEIQPTPSTAWFSPDGSIVATTGYDNSAVILHSISPSGALSTMQSLVNPHPVTSIAFSPAGPIVTDGLDRELAAFVPSSASSGTKWPGAFGSEGYDLAGWGGDSDASNLPNVSVSLLRGSRVVWAANTSDIRALTSPGGLTRTAAGYYDPAELQVRLTFNAAYTGNLRLYAVLWQGGGSKEYESIKVPGGYTVTFSDNPMMGSQGFSNGQWAIFPISEPAGGSMTIAVNANGWPTGAVLSGIFLGDAGPPPVSVSSSPQGTWVSAAGSQGYDLAGWNGVGDVSYMPPATATLVQGSRYQWASQTADVRALQSPDGLTRAAATYYDPNQIQLKLSFPAAYSGNLHLYALDWDSTARRETITVGGSSAALGEFKAGAWVSFPISVAAGGTVTVTVTREAGANAVLSGIFLGDSGAPPGPTVSSSPQGTWSGALGSQGYALAAWDGSSDASYLPSASLSLMHGSRYEWAQGTTDARALSDPSGVTRAAGAYYDPNQIQLKLSFPAAYSGNLHLYALDWDSTARRETITVGGSSAALGEFKAGAWVSFPVSVAAGGTVTITVDHTSGANAVLSGIFLGDGGAPPAMATSSAPQGSWVGTYGSGGYDLLGFGGSSDLTSFSSASVSVDQASRYTWASSTADARALQSPDKSSRLAATLYDANQIRLHLSFTAPYSGNLELYALDWDSTARREMVSVNGQTAVLSGEFKAGAWLSFPISVVAGGTVAVTVDRLAGANAVLSGVFLG
jgi:WD40 repeat protein